MLFNRKLILVLLSILGAVIITGIVTSIVTNRTYLKASSWVDHTHEVLFETEQLFSSSKDIQITSRNYVLTGDTSFLSAFDLRVSQCLQHLNRLKKLTADNPRQQSRFDSLTSLIQQRIAYSEIHIQTRKNVNADSAIRMIAVGRSFPLMAAISKLIEEVEADENILLEKRRMLTKTDLEAFQRVFYIVLVTALMLLLMIMGVMLQNTRLQKRINKRNQEISYILGKIVEGFVILDKSLSVTYANERALQLFRMQKNALPGLTITELLGNDPVAENIPLFENAFQTQQYFHTTSFHETLERWLEIHAYPSPEGLFLFVRDITEAKNAEHAIIQLNESLEKSAQKFRALIENSYDMVSIIGPDFKTIYRSPSASKITGWSDEENLAMPRASLTHPDDLGKLKAMMNFLLANPGLPYQLTFRTRHKAGHYIWMEGISTNLAHEEAIGGIVANFKDVTKTREAEEKLVKSEKLYKTIASSIPDSLICLMDDEYRYQLIEGDLLARLGFTSQQLLGNRVSDILKSGALQEVVANLRRAFNGDLMTRESTINGFDLISRYIPLKDEQHRVYSVMIVTLDVTRLKSAQRSIAELNRGLEEKIAERTEELKKSNEELEAFSYSVSHDLRSPLRAVSGYASIIEEDFKEVLNADGIRMLKSIQTNARKMGALIDDLLAFSRLGRQDVARAEIDMTELAEKVLTEFSRDHQTKASIVINPLLPALADYPLIKQVMVNLLSNAIKYSSARENPRIEVCSQQNDNEVVYSVSDNGAGFNMKYADKLFGVFQRLHANEEFEGTGIGLAIVKRIINKHHGRVWAEGTVGNGATFYFSLPLQPTVRNMV